MRIRETIEKLTGEERTAIQERLDEAVHDAKGQEASEINNRGLAAQIEYLGVEVACQLLDECFQREPASVPSREAFAQLTAEQTETLVEYLDEAVHDAKDEEAAAINNRSLEAQVEYLDPRIVLDCAREVTEGHKRVEVARILESYGLNTQGWPDGPVEIEHALRRAVFAGEGPLELSARGELLDALRAIHRINADPGSMNLAIARPDIAASGWRGR